MQDDYYNVANGFETRIERFMQELVRPHRYRHQRPSFYSAYAKAAHRYEFDCGRYAGFAKRDGVVVKVAGLYDKSAEHEVPAESIHNGASPNLLQHSEDLTKSLGRVSIGLHFLLRVMTSMTSARIMSFRSLWARPGSLCTLTSTRARPICGFGPQSSQVHRGTGHIKSTIPMHLVLHNMHTV